MSENVAKLPRNQRRAIAALLESRSIVEAAAACRLNEKTLQRYMADPAFKTALLRAESELLDQTTRRLLAGQEKALTTLENLIDGAEKDSDQRLAAVAWLDLSMKLRDLHDIERRLTDLEERAFGTQKRCPT